MNEYRLPSSIIETEPSFRGENYEFMTIPGGEHNMIAMQYTNSLVKSDVL